MSNQDVFTFKLGGMAGQGIKSAGIAFAKVVTRSGYFIYTYTEYPSLIRGGHNVMQISISESEVNAPYQSTNFLIALNQQTIDLHVHELVKGGGLLFDASQKMDTSKVGPSIRIFPVPLLKLAHEVGGKDIMSNTVAVAATLSLMGGEVKYLKDLLAEEFADKKPLVIALNHACVDKSVEFVTTNFADKKTNTLKAFASTTKRMVVSGNEAVAMGAIGAGLQFASIYPMTPTSNILHILAPNQQKYGFIYIQPEDEISAINMAIGAAHAGARAMVATSGGGFSLMTEGYGLGAMTETPLVIIEGMRGGPATGLPTWNGQGDLRFMLHAHQDDFTRIVLAAGDAKEAFEPTQLAFNLSEKYQTPVIVLVDKNLCENDQGYEPFDYSKYQIDRGKFTLDKIENYQRYQHSEDGVSTRTIPGVGNFYIANSDEHDQTGYSDEESENRIQQMNKRLKKLATCKATDMKGPHLYGPQNADITLISWGTNKGSILEALKHFNNVNYLHLTWLSPFPKNEVKTHLEKAKYLINIECNHTAQMAGLIREKTGIKIMDHMLKYDGRPIFPEEIITKINQVVTSNQRNNNS